MMKIATHLERSPSVEQEYTHVYLLANTTSATLVQQELAILNGQL